MTNGKFLTNIVVAIDGSDLSMKAANHTLSIAKEQDAKVYAVVVKFHQSDAFRGSTSTLQKFIQKEAEIAQKWLDSVGADADRNNVRFESNVIKTTSSIPEEIIKYAKGKR